jgi:hypothetical protein
MKKKVTLMLADHAAVADGKLYINGGGWTIAGANAPYAIVVSVEVPWDETSEHQAIRLELIDSDGQPVMVTASDGSAQPRVTELNFDVGRPAGMPKGAAVPFMVAINSPPENLQPDQRYEWRLTWNGETNEDWRLVFSTPRAPLTRAA